MTPKFLSLALPLLVLAWSTEAQMYKWVDEKGVTHYSETPPANGKADAVPIRPRASVPSTPPALPVPDASRATRSTPSADSDKTRADQKAATSEAERIAGDWKSGPGDGTLVQLVIRKFGDGVLVSFSATIGGNLIVNEGNSWDLRRSNGKGVLEQRSLRTQPNVPNRIGYSLERDTLTIDIGEGRLAGRYRLTR